MVRSAAISSTKVLWTRRCGPSEIIPVNTNTNTITNASAIADTSDDELDINAEETKFKITKMIKRIVEEISKAEIPGRVSKFVIVLIHHKLCFYLC